MIMIVIFMLVGMTAYETLKQIISPNITIWESHIITILFSTICAVVASYFILRKQMNLTDDLVKKNIEGELLRKQLSNMVAELRTTLSEIKTLSGLLPICSSCKKIRDDKGYWNQIESYISEHSGVDFSHSICPECAKTMYLEFYEENKGDITFESTDIKNHRK